MGLSTSVVKPSGGVQDPESVYPSHLGAYKNTYFLDPTGDLGIRTLGLGFRYLQTEGAPSTLVNRLLPFESSDMEGVLGPCFL